MEWWLWMLLGLGLLAFELATPGGPFALFFGIGALAEGAVAAAGWAGPPWTQWLLFSVFSVASLALLRGPLKARLNLKGSDKAVDALVGESAVPLEDLPSGGVGKAELRGAPWNARNAAGAPLARGQRCVVERVEGLTIWIRPE